jgi:hypothetical protein
LTSVDEAATAGASSSFGLPSGEAATAGAAALDAFGGVLIEMFGVLAEMFLSEVKFESRSDEGAWGILDACINDGSFKAPIFMSANFHAGMDNSSCVSDKLDASLDATSSLRLLLLESDL